MGYAEQEVTITGYGNELYENVIFHEERNTGWTGRQSFVLCDRYLSCMIHR